MPVGHLEGVGEDEIDLVLAQAPLSLGRFDRDSGALHAVTDLGYEPLVLRGLEEVVVRPVVRHRLHVAVELQPGVAVVVAEEEHLDFRPAEDLEPVRFRALDLALQDLPRRHLDRLFAVLLHGVAQYERRAVEPRNEAKRRPVGNHREILKSSFPVGERESRLRLHVHVDREQVVGSVQAFAVQQVAACAGRDALAHEAPPDVDDRADDRVDASRAEQFLELFGVNMAVWSDVQCGLPAS